MFWSVVESNEDSLCLTFEGLDCVMMSHDSVCPVANYKLEYFCHCDSVFASTASMCSLYVNNDFFKRSKIFSKTIYITPIINTSFFFLRFLLVLFHRFS